MVNGMGVGASKGQHGQQEEYLERQAGPGMAKS